MGDKVSRRAIDAYDGLVTSTRRWRTAGLELPVLLRPVIELLWVDDVVRLNASRREGHDDVVGHCSDGESQTGPRPRSALDNFGARCFDRGAASTPASPIDHVPPWSRVGIDGWPTSSRRAPRECLEDQCASCAMTVHRVSAVIGRLSRPSDGTSPGRSSGPGRETRLAGLHLASSPGSPLGTARALHPRRPDLGTGLGRPPPELPPVTQVDTK